MNKAKKVIVANIEEFDKTYHEYLNKDKVMSLLGKSELGGIPLDKHIKNFITSSHTSLTQAISEDLGERMNYLIELMKVEKSKNVEKYNRLGARLGELGTFQEYLKKLI